MGPALLSEYTELTADYSPASRQKFKVFFFFLFNFLVTFFL